MPKYNKSNLLQDKEKEYLKKRQVYVTIDVDNIKCPALQKQVLKLIGNKLEIPIDANHVKEYFETNYKKDKEKKKTNVIKVAWKGKDKRVNFYDILRVVRAKVSNTFGLQYQVSWRGKDNKGKKYPNLEVKEDMFVDKDTVLGHFYENKVLKGAISKNLGMNSHWFTTVNDDYESK